MAEDCVRYLVALAGVFHKVYVRRGVCEFAPDPLGCVRGLPWPEAREKLAAMGAVVKRVPEGAKC